MIKNQNKFSKLKCFDISKARTTNNNIVPGISSTTYGKKWFVLSQGKVLFKTFDGEQFRYVKKYRIINELMCYELAKMMGVKCARYEPAIKKENDIIKTGAISFKVNTSNQVLKTLYDDNEDVTAETFSEIVELMKQRSKNDKILLDPDFEFDLFKMVVFDILTLQQDRHLTNIHIIDDKKQNKRMLSPLIDNEMAFGVITLNQKAEERKTDINFSDIVESMNSSVFLIKYVKFTKNHNFTQTIKDAVIFARRKEKYMNFLKNAIKNFDVKLAIQQVEEKNIKISDEYKRYVYFCKRHIKDLFINNIKHYEDMEQEI